MYRLHAWGGLGAQLTSLFVKKYIESKYKLVKVTIALHNDPNFDFSYSQNGLELRDSEADLEVFQDYLVPKHLRSFNYSYKTILFSYLNKIANMIRWRMFQVDHIGSLRQWEPSQFIKNLEVSNVSLDCDIKDLKYFSDYLELNGQCLPTLVLHWRLGDLYTRSSKSAGDQFAIADIYLFFLENYSFESKYVFTESPDLAKNLLETRAIEATIFENVKFIGMGLPAWELLSAGCTASIFVGTYSKLSLWVAAIRSANGRKNQTYLPSGIEGEFYRLFPMFPKNTIQVYPA